MRRFVPALIVVLVASVSWIFINNFTVSGIGKLRVEPRARPTTTAGRATIGQKLTNLISKPSLGGAANKKDPAAARRATAAQPPRLRIGTFNLGAFNGTKARKPKVVDVLAQIGREFDVLAVQEVRSSSDDSLPRFVDLMNRTGQSFDYAVGERVGRDEQPTQFAFIFNTRSVQIDRNELYTVDDRDGVLTFPPLVAWFRAVGPKPDQSFTFSLVNVEINPETAVQEREYLDDLLFAVRNDGRDEDDVILLGDFQAAPGHLGPIDDVADIGFAVTDVPTNVEANATLENLIFRKTATAEFTGNAGVFDFLRQYNLDLEEALEVSDHLPVWAEFTVFEGGQPGRVASRPATDGKTR